MSNMAETILSIGVSTVSSKSTAKQSPSHWNAIRGPNITTRVIPFLHDEGHGINYSQRVSQNCEVNSFQPGRTDQNFYRSVNAA